MKPLSRWALQWSTTTRLDGLREHIVMHDQLPCLFVTKREAQAYSRAHFGYIAKRRDLQQEPHCWRMPKPIRVQVSA